MKKLLLSLAALCTLQANAQPYTISFAGSGLATVKVQNLATGAIVDVPAGDVLLLSTTTYIPEINNLKSSGLKVYPNPMTDKSTLEILPPLDGEALISIFDLTGKVITQYKTYLEKNSQKFSISGLKNGLHIINVKGNGFILSEKLISNGNSNGLAIITRESNNIQAVAEKESLKDSKGTQATVDMAYNNGERLKFTAISGNNSTVMTDIPSADKTITFTFTECKDGDNNYYPVVQIGIQLWMAENLETTKYNDGISIPLVSDISAWNSLTTSGYCWYGNNETLYKALYGALYNWRTVITGKLCPAGWHVPADSEWTNLTTYLGGEAVAGAKLKETGTIHWTSPNVGATNETGFTARPGGYRSYNYSFTSESIEGFWWSSTESNTVEAWYRDMNHGNIVVRRGGGIGTSKINGLSVRCIKD